MNATHVAALSPRELEVVSLLCDGFTPKEIAGRLELSLWTVKSHIANARKRTGSRTTVQLANRVRPSTARAGTASLR
jgi:DNA-binding CsgD family transcriptional regulator